MNSLKSKLFGGLDNGARNRPLDTVQPMTRPLSVLAAALSLAALSLSVASSGGTSQEAKSPVLEAPTQSTASTMVADLTTTSPGAPADSTPSGPLATLSSSEAALVELAKTDPDAAAASLASDAKTGMSDCHAVAHAIGVAAVKAKPSSLLKLQALRPDLCQGGIGHGATEEFAVSADEEAFTSELLTVCDKIASPLDGTCAHGIGHGITLRIPNDYRKAIESCTKLSRQVLVTSCAGGVSMAYITDRTPSSPNPGLRGRPSVVCKGLSLEVAGECWQKIWGLMERSTLALQLKECRQAPKDARCPYAVGVGAVNSGSLRGKPAKEVFAACGAEADYAEDCANGAAWGLANTHIGFGKSPDSYVSVCDSSPVKDTCRDAEKTALGTAVFDPNQQGSL